MAVVKKKKKKISRWKVFVGFCIGIIVLLLCMVVYQYWQERRASFVHYPAFGIDMPVNYTVHGIDVSRYQQTVSWPSVRAMRVNNIKIDFAFIKATEGTVRDDPYFTRNWKKCKEAGIVRGAYHFFLPNKDGRAQAENFIGTVDIEPGDLPPVLDVEHTYGVPTALLQKRVKEWLSVVHNHYGIRPILYTNVDFYTQYLKDEFDTYPLWVAHYLRHDGPRIYRDWHFWQHSEKGQVNGIASKVDFNVFNGSMEQLNKLLVQ
jgi:lysozyme